MDAARLYVGLVGLRAVETAAAMKELGIRLPKQAAAAAIGRSVSWNGGRRTAMHDRPMEDTVAIKAIEEMKRLNPLADFEYKWREPSAEARAAMAQRVDEKMNQARNEGTLTSSDADLGSSLG